MATGIGRGISSLILFFCLSSVASEEASTVRVKLAHLNFPLQVQGQGISVRGIQSADLTSIAIPREGRLQIDLRKISGQKTWIIKRDEKITRIQQKYVEITSADSRVRVSGYQIPTPVLISLSGDIISALPFNIYLEGVLAGEMPSSWPLEALKAQAVAARSYTLFQINQRKGLPYQLEGSILDQVFAATENSEQLTKIRRAIDETDGMVLKIGGQVVKAYYHSDCGGKTEDPELTWGGSRKNHALNSVVDQHCAFSPQSKWTLEASLTELKQKLQKSDRELSNLTDVRIIKRTPSGRVALLAFSGSEGGENHILISGNELRHILGFGKLKSTLFTISRDEDMITFSGRGFGHGSGLCQYGARYMAEKGSGVREILHHYYPTARLTEVNVADR